MMRLRVDHHGFRLVRPGKKYFAMAQRNDGVFRLVQHEKRRFDAAVAHRHQTESGIDKRFEPGRALPQMKRIAVKIEERRVAGACCVHPGLQSHFVRSLKKNVFHPLKTKRGAVIFAGKYIRRLWKANNPPTSAQYTPMPISIPIHIRCSRYLFEGTTFPAA
jgi:hypothetical protein